MEHAFFMSMFLQRQAFRRHNIRPPQHTTGELFAAVSEHVEKCVVRFDDAIELARYHSGDRGLAGSCAGRIACSARFLNPVTTR